MACPQQQMNHIVMPQLQKGIRAHMHIRHPSNYILIRDCRYLFAIANEICIKPATHHVCFWKENIRRVGKYYFFYNFCILAPCPPDALPVAGKSLLAICNVSLLIMSVILRFFHSCKTACHPKQRMFVMISLVQWFRVWLCETADAFVLMKLIQSGAYERS